MSLLKSYTHQNKHLSIYQSTKDECTVFISPTEIKITIPSFPCDYSQVEQWAKEFSEKVNCGAYVDIYSLPEVTLWRRS